MWPLLIVNYVKLIELKRLLMYSKESCNNLANIIHGHLDLSGLSTISIQQQQAGWWTRKEGRCLTVTRGWHWHNVTISGSDPRVWHGPLSQDSHSDSVSARVSHDADYKAGHVIIWTHLRAGPRSAHATGHSGLGAVNCYYWLSQPGPGPRSPAPWWGQSTLKIFLLRTKKILSTQVYFPTKVSKSAG